MTMVQCGRVAVRPGPAVRTEGFVPVSRAIPLADAGNGGAWIERKMADSVEAQAQPKIDVAVKALAAAGAPR